MGAWWWLVSTQKGSENMGVRCLEGCLETRTKTLGFGENRTQTSCLTHTAQFCAVC